MHIVYQAPAPPPPEPPPENPPPEYPPPEEPPLEDDGEDCILEYVFLIAELKLDHT